MGYTVLTVVVALAMGTVLSSCAQSQEPPQLVMDGSVATSDADLVLNNTSIATGQVVSISAGTIIRANQ